MNIIAWGPQASFFAHISGFWPLTFTVRAQTDYDNSTWENCPKQKVVVCSNVGTIVPRH